MRCHGLVASISTQIMFNQIPPAGAGGLFNPSLQGLKIFPESHHRQVADCSIPATVFRCRTRELGLNNPPPAGGGIQEYSYALCRSGLNNPPPAGGGIRKTRTCIETNGARPWHLQVVGINF